MIETPIFDRLSTDASIEVRYRLRRNRMITKLTESSEWMSVLRDPLPPLDDGAKWGNVEVLADGHG